VTAPRSFLSTGYVALDAIRRGESLRHVAGGTAANVAANLAYFSWNSAVMARLGDDAPGRRINHDLVKAGVNSDGVIADSTIQTPVVIHEVNPPEHRFHFKCPVCERRSSKHRPLEVEQLDHLLGSNGSPPQADVVFADRMSAASVALLQRSTESLRVLEPSAKGNERLAIEAAGYAEVLKWSHENRDGLHAPMLRARPDQLQIESLGAEGLRFRQGDEGWRHVGGLEVDIADAAGAGDWLTAAFLNELPSMQIKALSKPQILAALETAQSVAALSCLYIGARTLAGVPLAKMRVAAESLRKGELSAPPTSPAGRPSEASDVCSLCLGSLDAG
jgi:fructokinase